MTVALDELRRRVQRFAEERDWERHHTPRNLVLALVGEVGELAEIFQWRSAAPVGLEGWSAAEREHVGEELADVLIYLVRLADRCGVDLGAAALDKLAKNARKYPPPQLPSSSSSTTSDDSRSMERQIDR